MPALNDLELMFPTIGLSYAALGNTNQSKRSSIKPCWAGMPDAELLDLQAFAKSLKTASVQCLPSGQKPFTRVTVLAFHWQDSDQSGVVAQERELLRIFGKFMGFAMSLSNYRHSSTNRTN